MSPWMISAWHAPPRDAIPYAYLELFHVLHELRLLFALVHKLLKAIFHDNSTRQQRKHLERGTLETRRRLKPQHKKRVWDEPLAFRLRNDIDVESKENPHVEFVLFIAAHNYGHSSRVSTFFLDVCAR